MDDSQLFGVSPVVVEVDSVGGEEATSMTEAEVGEMSKSGGKRMRDQQSRVQTKASARKNEEEDVCFICFDGGNLVLCDHRGCPKGYHPACLNQDEAFFRSKARWNCGWHICSNCEKAAQYMCYTCTYSMCKGCIKAAEFLCVRGNKGFCETCMRTVMLIENNERGRKEMAQIDFDDKNSWEYLFKVYWIDLKGKLSLTLDELMQARNPWKGSGALVQKEEPSNEIYDANDNKGSSSDSSTGHLEASSSKRRKAKKRSKSTKEMDSQGMEEAVGVGETSVPDNTEWASKELVEFVAHMKGGDMSILSQFDVQALLLEYIKRNNLRDPRRKSQIICDSRLKNLFGKARVGLSKMFKLLEAHFLIKVDSQADDIHGAISNIEGGQLEAGDNNDTLTKASKDKRRKTHKKDDVKETQTNLDDYAAIDVHNINLIYVRRNLMEELIEDVGTFHDKVVGSFVRIRTSGSGQKQDMYKLVQVVGTSKAPEPYKTGGKTTEIKLEVLNLDKTDTISIDTISNLVFSEDECNCLRQGIKCGLISRMTVGEVQEKAMALQAMRVNDWLETEILRLSHLRDWASEKGRRKQLRECVEKLQLLSTPEERLRRLQEIPEVHADPKMDPSYESDKDGGDPDDKRRDQVAAISLDAGACISQAAVRPCSSFGFAPENASTSLSTGIMQSANISETDKMWHYQDPSGKTQGPFSMPQLRKWSTTGSFPADLKIWRTEKQDESVLLTDALKGKFHREPPQWGNSFSESQKLIAVSDDRENNWDGGWGGNNSSTLTDQKQSKGSWDTNLKDSSGSANSNAEYAKGDVWATRSSDWSAPATEAANPKEGQGGSSSQGWDSSKGNNTWSGQPEVHSPLPSSPFSGKSSRMSVHQEREGQGGEGSNSGQNKGSWNSSRPRGFQSSTNWGSSGQSSGEPESSSWKKQTQGDTNTGWGTGQGSTAQGNSDMGWGNAGASSGNPGTWASQQKHNGERFSDQGARGFQGGDCGRGAGGKPWDRQSSFGRGSSRPSPKGQRVCKFHESGHCKKGAECEYLHT